MRNHTSHDVRRQPPLYVAIDIRDDGVAVTWRNLNDEEASDGGVIIDRTGSFGNFSFQDLVRFGNGLHNLEEMEEEIAAKSLALSINPEDHPRNNANQFLDKFTIVKAANDPEISTPLRESLPEEQRWKLDRAITHLQSGGTIHHPSESPGLGVDISGNISDPRWAEYAALLAKREEWVERDAKRAECRKCVEEFVKHFRKDKIDFDKVDKLLKEAGATSAELRALSRVQHRVMAREGSHEPLEDLYEETAESIHRRIDIGYDTDPEPDNPKEPSSSSVDV